MAAAAGQVRIPYRPRVRSADGLGGQPDFHRGRYRYRHRAMFTGTGGGKTLTGAFEALAWMLENPGCRGIVAEPDYKMVKRNLFAAFQEHFDGLGPKAWGRHPLVEKWNRSDLYLRLVNGSECWLIGMENPERVEGMNLDFVYGDELRRWRNWRDGFEFLMNRLRGSNWYDRLTEPARAYHAERHPRWPGSVQEAKELAGAWWSTHSPRQVQVEMFAGDSDERLPSSKTYRWSTWDAYRAGVIPKSFIEDVAARYKGRRAEAVLEGRYARPEGLVYDEFTPTHHVHEPPGGWEATCYGVDWGYSQPACLGAWVWQGSRAWGAEEWYGTRRSPRELARIAVEMEQRWGAGTWWCGPDQPGHIDVFRDHGLDARPYKAKVMEGLEFINAMFAGDELSFAPGMEHHRREVDEYMWAEGGEGEKPDKSAHNDHAMDAMRYALMGHLVEDDTYEARSW